MKKEARYKIYSLGQYLINESMEYEFLSLLKIAKDISEGEMPDFSWVENSKVITNISKSTDNPQEWIDRFIDLNSNKLLEFDILRHLGSGAYGSAWELKDHSVLKIFCDIEILKEYEKMYNELFDTSKDNKYNLRVYDYGVFTTPYFKKDEYFPTIGYAIIEKLEMRKEVINNDNLEYYDSKPNINSLINVVIGFADYVHMKDEFDNKSIDEIMKYFDTFLKNRLQFGSRTFDCVEELEYEGILHYKLNKGWVKDLLTSSFYSLRKGYPDIKPLNMGYRGTVPVYFDSAIPDYRYQNTKEEMEIVNWDKNASLSNKIPEAEMPNFSWVEKSEDINAISRYFEKPKEWMNRFIDLNSDKLLDWDIVRILGSGAYGSAYELKDNTVLKIFSGPGVIKEYERMYNDLFDPTKGQRHDLRVYDYGVFIMPDIPLSSDKRDFYSDNPEQFKKMLETNGHLSFDLGYAVVERLDVPKRRKDFDGRPVKSELLNIISNFCRTFYNAWLKSVVTKPEIDFSDSSIMNFIEKQDVLNKLDKFIFYPSKMKQYGSLKELNEAGIKYFNMPENWILEYMISIFKSLLRGHRDIKSDNFGYRGDTPVFFDAHRHEEGYKMPEELLKVRNWDKDAQLALLQEYLNIKIGQENKYNDLNNYMRIFGFNTVIKEYVRMVFKGANLDSATKAESTWIEDFIKNNIDVLSRYKIKKHLGSGAFADAWEIEDGRVLKIMNNDKDLPFYREQYEVLHSGMGSSENIMVYDFGKFKVPNAYKPFDVRSIKNMSWVVLERLKPIRQLVQNYDKELEGLTKHLKEYSQQTGDNIGTSTLFGEFKKSYLNMTTIIKSIVKESIEDRTDISKYINSIIKELMQDYDWNNYIFPSLSELGEKVGLPDNWLYNIIKSIIYNLASDYTDVHSGNVGFRGDKPIFFDPSNNASKHYNIAEPEFKQDEYDETAKYVNKKSDELESI